MYEVILGSTFYRGGYPKRCEQGCLRDLIRCNLREEGIVTSWVWVYVFGNSTLVGVGRLGGSKWALD